MTSESAILSSLSIDSICSSSSGLFPSMHLSLCSVDLMMEFLIIQQIDLPPLPYLEFTLALS